MDSNYSKRELDNSFKIITDHLEKQDVVLDAIKAQTTKTNGRVTALETSTKDYPDTKTKVWWIMGIGGASVVLVGVIYALLLKDITKTIQVQLYQITDSQKKTENSNISNNVTVK